MVSLGFYYKLANKERVFNFGMLSKYALFTCLDVVACRLIFIPIDLLINKNFVMTGAMYTAVGIPMSFLMAFFVRFIQQYIIISIDEKRENK